MNELSWPSCIAVAFLARDPFARGSASARTVVHPGCVGSRRREFRNSIPRRSRELLPAFKWRFDRFNQRPGGARIEPALDLTAEQPANAFFRRATNFAVF